MSVDLPEACAVAIVGGGPAGLAAATELAALGVGPVVVIEREPEIGGIPRHCGHPPFGMREFGRIFTGPAYAERLAARTRASGAIIATDTSVVSLAPGPVLSLSTPDGVHGLTAQRVLLATGVRETSRAARLIGGTRPGGVLSTGALQGLVYLDHIRPFRRPVILGTELVAFSALLTCRHIGIAPLAMIEPADRVTAFRPAGFFPRLLGTRLLLETEIVAIHGQNRVEAVVLRDRSGGTRTLETDGVIVSGRFVPESALLATSHLDIDPGSGGPAIDQFGRCSDPAYFAAGNLLRAVETAGWSWAEGRAAARVIARDLAGLLPAPGTATAVSVSGLALKYAVPARVVPGPADGAITGFQLRVGRAAKGRLTLSADGAEIWTRAIAALPERRISVPLGVLPAGTRRAEFSIVER